MLWVTGRGSVWGHGKRGRNGVGKHIFRAEVRAKLVFGVFCLGFFVGWAFRGNGTEKFFFYVVVGGGVFCDGE